MNDKYVIKSGTDFRNLSNITVTKNETGFHIDVKQVDLDSNVPEDSDVRKAVDKHVCKYHISSVIRQIFSFSKQSKISRSISIL